MLVDRPVEECGMEAFTTCRPVTRLAPSLEPKQTCRDVPRETCSSSKVDKYISSKFITQFVVEEGQKCPKSIRIHPFVLIIPKKENALNLFKYYKLLNW